MTTYRVGDKVIVGAGKSKGIIIKQLEISGYWLVEFEDESLAPIHEISMTKIN